MSEAPYIPPFLIMPLDARPVCYDFVEDLAAMAGLTVQLPPKSMLGQLKQPAPFEALFSWWTETLSGPDPMPVIAALDTLTFGGLISSRVNIEPIEDLEGRCRKYLDALTDNHAPRYAFSSVLRIPAYDGAEEEPDYWNQYGKRLYDLSVYAHQHGLMSEEIMDEIPDWVVQDFMARREKNFIINQNYLDLLSNNVLDFLIYAQDDTGAYGLNVQEAKILYAKANQKNLLARAMVQTGADEIALTLIARALWIIEGKPLKVFPWYFPDHGKQVLAKFDGVPVEHVVERNLFAMGAAVSLSPWDADVIVLVNAPSEHMGDHIPEDIPLRPKAPLNQLVDTLKEWINKKPVAICDVVYANGGDPVLLKALLESRLPLEKLAGYAGWNTPGNTIGSSIAMAAVSAWAERHGRLNETKRRELLLKRFLDDGVYQAEVRSRLRMQFGKTCPGSDDLNSAMHEGLLQWQERLKIKEANVKFDFPCKRTFEIGVCVEK